MIHLHPGYERIVEKEAGTFKYFLKIVPTEYVNLKGDPLECFSVTSSQVCLPSLHPMGLMFAASRELVY